MVPAVRHRLEVLLQRVGLAVTLHGHRDHRVGEVPDVLRGEQAGAASGQLGAKLQGGLGLPLRDGHVAGHQVAGPADRPRQVETVDLVVERVGSVKEADVTEVHVAHAELLIL